MDILHTSLRTSGEVGECLKHGSFEIKTLGFGRRTIRLDSCPECAEENRILREQERLERERIDLLARRQARFEKELDQAGIPVLFRNRTFENYEARTEGQQKALQRFQTFAEQFAQHLSTGTVLLGMGRVGTGKSHLACACANFLMAKGHTAYFTSTARLFTKIRGTWSKASDVTEEQMLKQFESIDLMILDEVGLQRGTDDEQRTLHELLEARRLNCKPTILLTNLDGANVKQYLGERFWDRLSESGVSVIFNWESHRRQVRDVGGLDNVEGA